MLYDVLSGTTKYRLYGVLSGITRFPWEFMNDQQHKKLFDEFYEFIESSKDDVVSLGCITGYSHAHMQGLGKVITAYINHEYVYPVYSSSKDSINTTGLIEGFARQMFIGVHRFMEDNEIKVRFAKCFTPLDINDINIARWGFNAALSDVAFKKMVFWTQKFLGNDVDVLKGVITSFAISSQPSYFDTFGMSMFVRYNEVGSIYHETEFDTINGATDVCNCVNGLFRYPLPGDRNLYTGTVNNLDRMYNPQGVEYRALRCMQELLAEVTDEYKDSEVLREKQKEVLDSMTWMDKDLQLYNNEAYYSNPNSIIELKHMVALRLAYCWIYYSTLGEFPNISKLELPTRFTMYMTSDTALSIIDSLSGFSITGVDLFQAMLYDLTNIGGGCNVSYVQQIMNVLFMLQIINSHIFTSYAVALLVSQVGKSASKEDARAFSDVWDKIFTVYWNNKTEAKERIKGNLKHTYMSALGLHEYTQGGSTVRILPLASVIQGYDRIHSIVEAHKRCDELVGAPSLRGDLHSIHMLFKQVVINCKRVLSEAEKTMQVMANGCIKYKESKRAMGRGSSGRRLPTRIYGWNHAVDINIGRTSNDKRLFVNNYYMSSPERKASIALNLPESTGVLALMFYAQSMNRYAVKFHEYGNAGSMWRIKTNSKAIHERRLRSLIVYEGQNQFPCSGIGFEPAAYQTWKERYAMLTNWYRSSRRFRYKISNLDNPGIWLPLLMIPRFVEQYSIDFSEGSRAIERFKSAIRGSNMMGNGYEVPRVYAYNCINRGLSLTQNRFRRGDFAREIENFETCFTTNLAVYMNSIFANEWMLAIHGDTDLDTLYDSVKNVGCWEKACELAKHLSPTDDLVFGVNEVRERFDAKLSDLQ